MFEIAKHYRKGPLSIRVIADKQNVSVAYLEQLLNRLRKSQLVKSRRGPGGGYILSKKPGDISVGMILKSLEGPVAIAQCLDPTAKTCGHVESCVARLLWKSLGEKIENFLETISLKDLLQEDVKMSR